VCPCAELTPRRFLNTCTDTSVGVVRCDTLFPTEETWNKTLSMSAALKVFSTLFPCRSYGHLKLLFPFATTKILCINYEDPLIKDIHYLDVSVNCGNPHFLFFHPTSIVEFLNFIDFPYNFFPYFYGFLARFRKSWKSATPFPPSIFGVPQLSSVSLWKSATPSIPQLESSTTFFRIFMDFCNFAP